MASIPTKAAERIRDGLKRLSYRRVSSILIRGVSVDVAQQRALVTTVSAISTNCTLPNGVGSRAHGGSFDNPCLLGH